MSRHAILTLYPLIKLTQKAHSIFGEYQWLKVDDHSFILKLTQKEYKATLFRFINYSGEIWRSFNHLTF